MSVGIIHLNKLFLIIITISIVVGLYLAELRSFDSFLTHDLVPINYPIDNYPIDTSIFSGIVNIDAIPGFIYTFTILSKITGLSAEQIMFIPLGSILLPLGYYIIAKYQFRYYYLLIFLIPLYIALDSGLIIGYYSIFKYAITYFLFFLFVSLYLFKWDNEKRSMIVVLLLLFVGMTLIHYSLATLTLLILSILHVVNHFKINRYRITFNMWLGLLVIFIVLKIPVFLTYAEFKTATDLSEVMSNSLNRVQTYLGIEDMKPLGKYTTFSIDDKNAMFLKGVRSLAITIPIIGYGVLYLFKKIIKPNLNIGSLSPLWFSIIIAGIAKVLLYTNIGSTGLINDFILVLYPFVAIIALLKMNVKPLFVSIYLIGLITISGASLLLELDDINYASIYESTRYNTLWFLTNVDTYKNIEFIMTSDHKTIGQHLLIGAVESKLTHHMYLSDEVYDSLVNTTRPIDFNTVILHLDDKPLGGLKWRKYEPINTHIQDINNNPKLNRVYSDSITIQLLTNRFK